MGTSAVYVFEYLAGLFFFGLSYWMLDLILPTMATMSVMGDIYDLAWYIWDAIVVVYLLFGIWYFVIRIKTWKFFNQQ